MPIDIKAGTIMLRSGLMLHSDMTLRTDTYSNQWEIVQEGGAMDNAARAVGWHFFFTAGTVNAFAFGRREGKNARTAIDNILSQVQAQGFNAMEVTEISTKHFLGIPYLSVCAHARHLQKGHILQENRISAT